MRRKRRKLACRCLLLGRQKILNLHQISEKTQTKLFMSDVCYLQKLLLFYPTNLVYTKTRTIPHWAYKVIQSKVFGREGIPGANQAYRHTVKRRVLVCVNKRVPSYILKKVFGHTPKHCNLHPATTLTQPMTRNACRNLRQEKYKLRKQALSYYGSCFLWEPDYMYACWWTTCLTTSKTRTLRNQRR